MTNYLLGIAKFFSAAFVAGLMLMSATAFAADRFAVISIANETQANITITYRWGDGPTKSLFFAPGAKKALGWKYAKPDQDKSPDLFIKFDADVGKSKYTEDKKLHGFRAPEDNYDLGHKYVFRYDGPSKKFIEIFDVSKK